MRERQARKKGYIDAARIRAFNKNCRPVAQVIEVFKAQPFQDQNVLDLLQRNDIGAASGIDLANRLRQHGQLVRDRLHRSSRG